MSNAIQHEYASYGYATDGSLALRPKSHTFVVIPGLASDPVDDWSEKGKDICGESEEVRSDRISPFSIAVIAAVVVVSVIAGSFGLHAAEAQRISNAFKGVRISRVVAEQVSSVWSYAELCKVKGVSTQEIADWIENNNDIGVNGLASGSEIVLPNYQD